MHFKISIEPKLMLACLFLLLVAVTGCQSKSNSKLAGTWAVDAIDSVLEQVNQNSSESEEDAKSTKDSQPRMTINFKSDGVLETATRLGQLDVKKSGTWKIVASDSPAASDDSNGSQARQRTNVACELAGQKTEHEIEWVDEDTIRLAPPNMAGVSQKLTFRRQ